MTDNSIKRVAFACELIFVGSILLIMATCIHYLLNPPQYDTELAHSLDQAVVETTGDSSVIEVPEDSATLKIVDKNGNTVYQIVLEDAGV